MFFLKIEGDLQAMRDVHHLAIPLSLLPADRDRAALRWTVRRISLLSALSTLLLLTYEDAMGAGE